MRQCNAVLAMIAWAAMLGVGAAGNAAADVVSASGTGTITYSSLVFPGATTGIVPIPRAGGMLDLGVAPGGGLEHAYLAETWDFGASAGHAVDAYIPLVPPPAGPARIEMVPSPVMGGPDAASITGTFDVLYTLDDAGLPSTLLAPRYYSYVLYAQPYGGAATFDASWDYYDVDAGLLLGSQSIHLVGPPASSGIVGTLPLTIAVPAGHHTLEVVGSYALWAHSDALYDTMIAVQLVPEPATLALLAAGGLGFIGRVARRRPK